MRSRFAASLIATAAAAQTPRLSNGRIESHATTNIARDLPALAATLTEPMWIGYAQPMIDGDHEMCDYWNNGRSLHAVDRSDPARARGLLLRDVPDRREADHAHPHLLGELPARCRRQGGALVHERRRQRQRELHEDVHGADRHAQDDGLGGHGARADRRRSSRSNELITLAENGTTSSVKGNALFWLAQRAGQKAVGTITAAIENDPDTEVKKKAVFALSQLPKDEGVPLLIQQARTNKNPAVRKQAMFWLGQSKDPRALKFFEEILR